MIKKSKSSMTVESGTGHRIASDLALEALDPANKAAMQQTTLRSTFMINKSKTSVTVESGTSHRIASDLS